MNVSTTFFALEGVRAYVAATVVDGILQSVRGMQSDHEQAEVLLSVLRSPRVDTMTRPAFLAAADTIHSEYEQTRVLAALVRAER